MNWFNYLGGILDIFVGFIAGFLFAVFLMIKGVMGVIRHHKELPDEVKEIAAKHQASEIMKKWMAQAKEDSKSGKSFSTRWYAEQAEKEIAEIIDFKED